MSIDPAADAAVVPEKSGGGAMKWVLIVLVILLVLLLACAGFCWWGGSALFGAATKPFEDLTEHLGNNEEVTSKLGTPIEQVSLFDRGSFNLQSSTGQDTEILFTIKGPDGRADVEGTTHQNENGDWRPLNLRVTFDDGTFIEVTE